MRIRAFLVRPCRPLGLTLVELLIAIAIGSVLSFGAVNLLLHSKRSYLQDEELARLQENGRYALRYISRELTMAGYLAGLLPGRQLSSVLLGSACFNHLAVFSSALEHVDDVTRSGVAAGGGSGLPGDCLVAGKHLAGTDMLLTRRTADAPVVLEGRPLGTIEAEALYLRLDGDAATAAVTRGPGSLGGQVDLWAYLPQVLFLRAYSVIASDGIPTLCRKRPARSSNRMSPTQCLIEGIENLQLEFGIDEDGDQRADRYAQQPALADLQSAVAARIYLLVRSVHPVPGHRDDRSYALGGTEVAAANDAYYRRVMQTTVLLRNAGAFGA